MRIVTVSDAHLLDLDAPDARRFLELLRRESGAADLVVLNGDVFDFLVGRQRRALRHYATCIDAIAACAEKTRVVYIQGNHDFHLQGVLPAAITIAESWDAVSGGKRMHWEHGDLIGVTPGYRRLRAFLRSGAVRRITEAFPPPLAWQLALLWSRTSRDSSPDTTEADMAAMTGEAEAVLARGHDVLITGHYHFPRHARLADGREWWGLGAWLHDCWYLETVDGASRLLRAED